MPLISVNNNGSKAFAHHLYSLSLRVISTAKTVTEMLSLLDLMSFRTAEFNSLWNSPSKADVNPFFFLKEREREKHCRINKNEFKDFSLPQILKSFRSDTLTREKCVLLRIFNSNWLKGIVLSKYVKCSYLHILCNGKMMISTHHLVQEHRSKAQNHGCGNTHYCHYLSLQTFE